MQSWQITLKRRVTLSGIGVHSGKNVSLILHPALPDTGIRFLRATEGGRGETIPATIGKLAATELAIAIGEKDGATICTIEHLMAAFYGLGVDNAIVEIDGGEVPIFDGSAKAFIEAIDEAGLATQEKARRVIEVIRPIRIDNGEQWAELLPHAGFKLDIDIHFEHEAIRRQRLILDVTPKSFRSEIGSARTFGFMRDAERLRAAGYGLGASYDNTVVLGDEGILNKEGLRFADEFVRHKALDAVGDLALAGLPLKALYRSYKGGHKLNAAMLRALLIDRSAYRILDLAPAQIQPVRVPLGLRLAAPTYTPSR